MPLAARVFDQDNAVLDGATVSWSSSNPDVATVSAQGLVTAVSNGTASITARSGSASAGRIVTVMQSAGRIVLEPSSATLMSLGETLQLSATVQDANGQAVEDAAIAWSSSDEGVATVSAQGLVAAVSNGAATITARSGSASATVTVTVMQSAGRIVIEPTSATLRSLGETVKLTASVLDANGQAVEDAALSWSSSDDGVATVSGQGLVTAVSNGTATITVRSGSASATATVTVMDNSRDREALVALYHSTGGPNWKVSTNWLTEALLETWHGVETNAIGQVTSLDLNGNNLAGPIPVEITQLQPLTVLDLRNNRLSGSIPSELGQLENLRYLNVYDNRLSGSIPSELGQLQNLTFLGLSSNSLTGSIPPELGQLKNLRYLVLEHNPLTGSIPPELGQLQNLRLLHLIGNALTGPIPPEIGQLTKLTNLGLNDNPGLTGPLPDSFLNLKLDNFYINDTNLCVPSTTAFRRWFGRISHRGNSSFCPDPERASLITLYERTGGKNWSVSTNWLSEESVADWHGVTVDEYGKVTGLTLAENNLVGSIPGQLGDLASLKVLDLSNNEGLSGLLPRSFIGLNPERLILSGTEVCAPPDPEFTQWLGRIFHADVIVCTTDIRPDYYALAAFYQSTNGPGWTNSDNWLSDKPLGTWYGVSTDSDGRVTKLDLGKNNLRGQIPSEIGKLQELEDLYLIVNELNESIPPELGQLQNLRRLSLLNNQLTGSIPPEIGQLKKLNTLNLSWNQLTGPIPPEIGQLKKLETLYLIANELNESIPPELGQLQNLRRLSLSGQLSGPIPPELGRLRNLTRLDLIYSQLSGPIPPELGQLRNLTFVRLNANQLSGPIPPELGRLQNLKELDLRHNQLSGVIPPELGQLQYLEWLRLSNNQFTGVIPPELGQLQYLEWLGLSNNQFTGAIPPELGQLQNLTELHLASNRLSGNVPSTFGDLTSLKVLSLSGNADMSGTLPLSLINLNLESLGLADTRLCAPPDPAFQDWLRTTPGGRVEPCVSVARGRLAAYLTQATQSLTHPVPLVAGEDALLRVFVATQADEEIPGPPVLRPPVKAAFYLDGAEVHSVVIPGGETDVPEEIYEGDLSASANATVPGSIIMTGLEMVVEIGHDVAPGPVPAVVVRLPQVGRLPVDVRDVPPFHLTMVPFLWTEDPDRSILTQVESLTAESDLFRYTRDILPVDEFLLDVHEPVWISVDPGWENHSEVIRLTKMISEVEGSVGHIHMGVLRSGGGWGELGGLASVSVLEAGIIAHELGHNFNLKHAPCGGAGDPDRNYPYPDGSIGAWGYDLLEESVISPDTPELMSYCGPPDWISDYHFTKALNYRVLQAQSTPLSAATAPVDRSLLLWGGVDENGEIVLEPAFVVDASAALPELDGPYLIEGVARDGGTLFRLSFGMPEISHSEGGVFAFILPARSDWPDRLARITLSGPEGVAILGGEDELDDWDAPAASLLLDPVTGSVRGLLRDWPDQGISTPGISAAAARRAAARSAVPEPGLEVVISRGIPSYEDWER